MDDTKALPEDDFDAIISALSIHHLDDAQKENLFIKIYDMLPKGGILVNYDQFCADTPMMNEWFNTYDIFATETDRKIIIENHLEDTN